MLGPELMWNGASAGDAYKLHFKEKYVEYTEYFTSSPPASHLLPEDDWRNLTLSGVGAETDPLHVELGRYSAGMAYQRPWAVLVARSISS